MSDRTVIEWATFRAAPGVTDEQVLRASGELQEGFLERQPGLLRRELLRGEGDVWVDVLLWSSRNDLERAMAAAKESPVCARYFGIMAGPAEVSSPDGMLHFEVAATYARHP